MSTHGMFLRRKTITPLSDEDLVTRVKNADRSALAALWDRYAQLLFGVCMKYLRDTEAAKDAVVDLFAALPGLLMKHEVKTFRPWVHTVARNHCLMRLRKHDPHARLEEVPDALAEGEGEEHLREAELQRLESAIEQLPEGQRACIRLFHLERNDYRATAERSGFSVEQVRSHLQNGRRTLRIILQRTHHGH